MTSVVYDPSENEVRIGGYSLTGVVEIRVNRGNDSFKNIDGIDAVYSARVKSFPHPFRLNVKLLQTSDSNVVLQHLYASSEANANSFFRVEVLSSNSSPSKPNISSTGYILSAPDLVLGNDTTEREWSFVVNALQFTALTDLIY